MELSPSEEDYLETIYLVKKEYKTVKPIEVAKKLNVRKPSVTGAVKKLSKKGFIQYKKYGDIKITEEGEKTARDIYKKHQMLMRFFTEVLKLEKSIAEEDACKIEHTLSKKTLNKLTRFIQKAK